jgi:hypothetical protein
MRFGCHDVLCSPQRMAAECRGISIDNAEGGNPADAVVIQDFHAFSMTSASLRLLRTELAHRLQ